ncbi:MAG: serine/threonine-protein kinase [Planctomycetota bacterium]|jgi:serine/threonine-protein kinase
MESQQTAAARSRDAPRGTLPVGGLHREGTLDASFETELNAYLQRRLRLVTGFLGIAATFLLVVSRAMDIVNHGWVPANLVHPAVITHAVACLVAVGLHLVLRRGMLSGRTLRFIDGLIVELVILSCLLVLYFSYEFGMRQQVTVLGLLLMARAIVVPSRPGRTFALSCPAPIGLLALQLHLGQAYAAEGLLFPETAFPSHVVWNQAVLWLSVALATLTSQVSFSLRMKAFEAARVDRYTLEGRIGGGAMGEVFRARHRHMRRPAAVKVLRPEIAGRKTLERFEREVQLTSRLTHPNTVSVFDFGQTAEGLFYYAMELLDGADLEVLVERTGPMPPARVIHVMQQACASLHEAHGVGLVHRDVKPANIMLCHQGGEADVVKVMDFGLVKDMASSTALSSPDALSGTPLTMAPEVIRGEEVSPAADLYALGVVGCFLLTGRPIFEADSPAEVLLGHLREPPVPPSRHRPDVPVDLEACLLAALAKDKAARPASAAAFRRILLSCDAAGGWRQEDAEAWWMEHEEILTAAP